MGIDGHRERSNLQFTICNLQSEIASASASPHPFWRSKYLPQEHRLSKALRIEQLLAARGGTRDTGLFERVDVFVVKRGVASLGVRHHGGLRWSFQRHDLPMLATKGIVPCYLFDLAFDDDFRLFYIRPDLEAELPKDLFHLRRHRSRVGRVEGGPAPDPRPRPRPLAARRATGSGSWATLRWARLLFRLLTARQR